MRLRPSARLFIGQMGNAEHPLDNPARHLRLRGMSLFREEHWTRTCLSYAAGGTHELTSVP